MHPLLDELSELSNEEVQKKHSDLMQKLNQAYGMGNQMLINQINMIMESYQEELNKRNKKMFDDLAGKDDKWKDLIDIGKKK
jgi:hypothetical protein|tara:strand:- start:3400 stop:3645 length:246 start_codon:yes stop_codon:yes gene_type:complete